MSSYEVIARRWRPQEFSSLVGQDHISQTLLNALKNNRLHHALLFTGPRGTGKTSTARILAKALRCTESADYTPCGKCSDCIDIQAGRNLNVLEIDGASNNGVDAIRELRDTVGYMPSSGKYKIYIIDEVHMLSQSAFNALLKTLEEPPGHVFFIFATTEVQKIPNTILSRCQRFDFRKIPTKLVTDHLRQIAKAENIDASNDALWAISRQGGGSMRDAQSLLEQMINFTNGKIEMKDVINTLGLTDRGSLARMWTLIAQKDSGGVCLLLQDLNQSHIEPKRFMEDLLEAIRNTLMLKTNSETAQVMDLPDSEIEALKQIAQTLTVEDLHFQFDMALKGAQDLAYSSDPYLVLEMVMLRMSSSPRWAELMSGATATYTPSSTPARNNMAEAVGVESTVAQAPTGNDSANWSELVEKIKGVNGLIGAQLENCYLKSLDGKKITLAVPEKLKFIYDKINQPDFKKKLGNYLTTFWGPGYLIDIQLASLDSSAAPTPKTMAGQKKNEAEAKEREMIENHPMVKSAQELFKAEIKSIKEVK